MKQTNGLVVGVLCTLALTLTAQVPQLINYQGRIVVASTNFDGVGQFKFALINGTGSNTFWSNDGTSTSGSEPVAAVSLTVAKGLYSVLLGDATLPSMSIVPATVFTNSDVRLRVWFNDGSHGSQLMTPDQRIAAVGYAMMAGSAQTVPDGAITTSKIAAGAVLAGNIAVGAVGSSQLASGAVQSANLAIGSVTAKKLNLGAAAGTLWDGTLNGVNSGTATFSASFPVPFIGVPDVTLAPAGWTLASTTSTGFTASVSSPDARPDTAGTVGQYTSLKIVDGKPAVAYYGVSNGNLKFVRAADAAGLAWGTPLTLDSANDVGSYTSLELVDGKPAISYYYYHTGDLKYVRATDAAGTAWAAPVNVDTAGTVGLHSSLRLVNGNPAIAYYDASNGDLKFVRAADAAGTVWGTPVTVSSANNSGQYASLAVINGNPAITYYDATWGDLKFVRATDPNGAAWGTPVTLDGGLTNVGQFTSLLSVNGCPAVSYYDVTSSDLRYIQAVDVNGSSWRTPVVLDSTGDVGRFCSLAIIGGKLVVSYSDYSLPGLKLIQSADANGIVWGNPLIVRLGAVGTYASLAPLNGQPAVSYYDSGDLGFTALPALRWTATDGTAITPAVAITVADGMIGSSQLGAQAVQTANLATGAVGNVQLAANAVQAGNIGSGAVGNVQLAANAVQAGNIGSGAVGATHLAPGAAAANLSVSGQSVVASGGIVLSETVNPNLVNAGYVRIGTTTLNDEWEQRNGKDAPAARDRHTAVWTGSEMIIWGGAPVPEGYEPNFLNDGARYNPATGAWTAISTNGAPSGRISHTAVWTGSEMIIWGGQGGNDFGYTNVPGGARYNPASNSWTTVSTVAAPTLRSEHTAVWTGTEMVVWGGVDSSHLGDGACYNPATDSWMPVSSLRAPSERRRHTAVWTGSKMIVWGGMTNTPAHLPAEISDGACYTPSSNSWAPVSIGPLTGRERHLAAWTGSEMFIWGGGGSWGGLNHGALYSPTSDSWTVIQSSGEPYVDPGVVFSFQNVVWTGSEIIVQGFGGVGFYLPSEDIWKAASTPPHNRVNNTAVWTGSEMIIWGGNEFTDTWIYHLPKTLYLYQKP